MELSHGVAGLACGRLLAELGADVTRVIDIGPSRRTSQHLDGSCAGEGITAQELVSDMYKRRLGVDMNRPEARDILRSLMDTADVAISDMDRSFLHELGLDGLALTAENPALVYCVLSPFGALGPRQNWRGDSIHSEALGGWCAGVGAADGEPLSAPSRLGFGEAGIQAAAAVTAALVQRQTTSSGAFIDIAATDVIFAMMRIYSQTFSTYGIRKTRDGPRVPGSGGRYPSSLFPCKDGYVVMTIRDENQWSSALAMMGDPEWAGDPRYQDQYGMAIEYPEEVDELVIPWMMEHTRDELTHLARAYKVPLGPVRTIPELARDEQLEFRRFFRTVTIDGRDFVLPGTPAIVTDVHGNDLAVEMAAPAEFPPLRTA